MAKRQDPLLMKVAYESALAEAASSAGLPEDEAYELSGVVFKPNEALSATQLSALTKTELTDMFAWDACAIPVLQKGQFSGAVIVGRDVETLPKPKDREHKHQLTAPFSYHQRTNLRGPQLAYWSGKNLPDVLILSIPFKAAHDGDVSQRQEPPTKTRRLTATPPVETVNRPPPTIVKRDFEPPRPKVRKHVKSANAFAVTLTGAYSWVHNDTGARDRISDALSRANGDRSPERALNIMRETLSSLGIDPEDVLVVDGEPYKAEEFGIETPSSSPHLA